MKRLFKYSLVVLIILYVTTWFYSKPKEGFENDPEDETPSSTTPPTPTIATTPTPASPAPSIATTPPTVDIEHMKSTFLKELRGIADKLSDMVQVLEKTDTIRETYKDQKEPIGSDGDSDVENEEPVLGTKEKKEEAEVIEGFGQEEVMGIEKSYGGFSFAPL